MGSFFKFKQDKIKLNFKVWNRKGLNIQKKKKRGKKMNIAQAKEEIKNTVRIYTRKNEDGSYKIAPVHQRPVLLIGPPGIGKTAIMEQVAKECEIGLVAYTITHHTRQSAVGLPLIKNEVFGGKEYAVRVLHRFISV